MVLKLSSFFWERFLGGLVVGIKKNVNGHFSLNF